MHHFGLIGIITFMHFQRFYDVETSVDWFNFDEYCRYEDFFDCDECSILLLQIVCAAMEIQFFYYKFVRAAMKIQCHLIPFFLINVLSTFAHVYVVYSPISSW